MLDERAVEARITEYRRQNGMGPAKTTRTQPVASGGCPRCGHPVYDLGAVDYCPCEDCHTGGYVVRPNAINLAS
jgi:hypothetical protein